MIENAALVKIEISIFSNYIGGKKTKEGERKGQSI